MPVAKGPKGVKQEMEKFKKGELHSGKNGKVVTSKKQAVAIALSASGMSNKDKTKKGKK